jgi:hypothetical protein
MDGDEIFYKGGIDFFLFGSARAPKGTEVSHLPVTIEVGDTFCRRILVVGDRVWEKKIGNVFPSVPKPFKAIPLTLTNAFGGKSFWDGLDIPFPDNPEGKGFYLEEKEAVGKPLPNLEDPENPVRKWEDRPEPVGVTPCPMQSGLRVRNGVRFNAEGYLQELRSVYFNAAFPKMIVPQAKAGDRVKIDGVCEEGSLSFQLPDAELFIRLQFDREVIEAPLAIDQIGVEADKRRIFLAYRYPFRYVLHPMQKRSCELFVKSSSGGAKTP